MAAGRRWSCHAPVKHPLGLPPEHLKFVFAGHSPRAACIQTLHTDFVLHRSREHGGPGMQQIRVYASRRRRFR